MQLWQKTGDERHDDFQSNQDDDDPFQQFHALPGRACVNLLVEILDGIELAQDTGVPFAQVESMSGKAVHAGQELVAKQFRRIADALEENCPLQLHPGNPAQGARC